MVIYIVYISVETSLLWIEHFHVSIGFLLPKTSSYVSLKIFGEYACFINDD